MFFWVSVGSTCGLVAGDVRVAELPRSELDTLRSRISCRGVSRTMRTTRFSALPYWLAPRTVAMRPTLGRVCQFVVDADVGQGARWQGAGARADWASCEASATRQRVIWAASGAARNWQAGPSGSDHAAQVWSCPGVCVDSARVPAGSSVRSSDSSRISAACASGSSLPAACSSGRSSARLSIRSWSSGEWVAWRQPMPRGHGASAAGLADYGSTVGTSRWTACS